MSDSQSRPDERLEARTRELETMLEVSRTLAGTLELDELLPIIFEQLRRVVACNGISVSLLEPDGSFLLLDYLIPGLETRLPKRWQAEDPGWIEAHLHQLREPVIIPDVLADTYEAGQWRQNATRTGRGFVGIRSWIGIPLIVGKRPIGMLTLEHTQPGYYTVHHARLALAVANHVAIAIENAQLYAQARELAALQERQKLARDLHDNVSQALYGIRLGTQTARALLQDEELKRDALDSSLEYIHSLANVAQAEMRALIFELRPESLELEGLIPALRRRLEAVAARHELQVEVDLAVEPELPVAAKEALYRVAQEALQNIVKHAHATRVFITLTATDDQYVLDIQDNGCGFDPHAHYPGHLGLESMRERIAGAGGHVTITSAPGEGARVCAVLPHSPPL